MMMDKMGAKKKAIEELMGYLDGKDGEELSAAMKPPVEEAAVVEGAMEPDGDEAAVIAVEGGEPEMSEEEIAELIEALQSKLG